LFQPLFYTIVHFFSLLFELTFHFIFLIYLNLSSKRFFQFQVILPLQYEYLSISFKSIESFSLTVSSKTTTPKSLVYPFIYQVLRFILLKITSFFHNQRLFISFIYYKAKLISIFIRLSPKVYSLIKVSFL
jgi:hypothetical protein